MKELCCEQDTIELTNFPYPRSSEACTPFQKLSQAVKDGVILSLCNISD